MKIKVLYLEDEANLGKIVTESLATRDFEVLWVEDGGKATDKFREFDPDICVLDVMLPNKDGFTIGKEIRALNERMPIIFLTAKSKNEDVITGFDSGGNDYIRKPFSMEELIVRIKNLLQISGQVKQDQNDELAIGQIIFTISRQELTYDNISKKLSFREAQLLHLLASNKMETVLRKTILDNLWGDDSFFNSRSLDVYITKLRDYMKYDDSVKIITLKGVGYRMVW